MQLGILPILGIIFVTLKLCNVIAWSWLWVLSPFWLVPIIYFVFLGVLVLFAMVSGK